MAVIPKPYRAYKLGPPPANARQRVLTQWRGVDADALAKTSLVRTRKAGDLLPKVLTDMRIDVRRGEAEVLKVWNNLIDPGIVAHAQPTGQVRQSGPR